MSCDDFGLKVGDVILVPDSDENNSKMVSKYVGGYATINRIVVATAKDGSPKHYLTVLEHTGYKEYEWEGFLKEMQETLNKQFSNTQRAYIKSI